MIGNDSAYSVGLIDLQVWDLTVKVFRVDLLFQVRNSLNLVLHLGQFFHGRMSRLGWGCEGYVLYMICRLCDHTAELLGEIARD